MTLLLFAQYRIKLFHLLGISSLETLEKIEVKLLAFRSFLLNSLLQESRKIIFGDIFSSTQIVLEKKKDDTY